MRKVIQRARMGQRKNPRMNDTPTLLPDNPHENNAATPAEQQRTAADTVVLPVLEERVVV